MNVACDNVSQETADWSVHNEASFRSLIENIFDVIAILEPDATIRYESPSMEDSLGFSLEERVGHKIFEFIHPDDVPKMQEMFIALAQNAYPVNSGEIRLRHKDGSWRVFEGIAKNLLHDPVIRGILVNARDITERKRMDEAARASEERYRGLFESMLEGFALCEVICGANGKPCDYRYLEVNAAFEKILGVTRGQALGRTVRELFPQVEDSWIEVYGKVALTGEPVRFENYLRALDKHFEVVAFSPKHGQFAAIFQDITEHTRAEKRLRLQSTALETAANGIVITDRDGSILWTNPAFSRLTGYSAEEVIGQNPRVLKSGKHDEGFYRNLWQTVTSGQVWHGEMINCRKDGTQYNEEMTITPVRNESGEITHFIAIKQDITGRKQTETSLRESEEMFRSLSASSPLGIYLTDIRGRCTYANPRCREILGCSLMESQNDGWANFAHPDDRGAALHGWRDYVGSGEGEYSLEYRIQRRDGTICAVHLRAAPLRSDEGLLTGFVGSLEDITDRKQAESLLRETESKYRAVVNQLPAITYIADFGRQGTWAFVSPQVESLLGFPVQEWLTNPQLWLKQMHPDDRERVMATEAASHGSGQAFVAEYRMITRDGRVRWFRDSAVPVRSQADQWLLHGVMLDITERKLAEDNLRASKESLEHALDELKTAQRQVIQQERLRALGTMASGIAHDFNNALAAILGFSELLCQRPENLADKEKTLHYLQMMNTAAKDAGSVVNRLREFYRQREEGEVFTPVDLNQLVQQAISFTQPKWKNQAEVKGIAIHVVTELGKIPAVVGSAADLREALTNLIFNAVDAIPQGGTITLRTHSDNSRVTLEVADTGMGMTEEVRHRCLEPFFTTKGDHGTGLGLSMVYGILQRHEGTIDIQTTLGRGTTFILSLPSKVESPAATEADSAPAAVRPLRILLVDDEEMVRLILREYLVGDGHTVTTATNGSEGFEKSQGAEFDVALLDRAMPGMSGDQAAAAIKRIKPGMPVILLTGFGNMMQAAGERPPGVDLVLAKPVTIAGLRSALANVVASR